MKFAYRNREFWCKGYYVDTAGKNTKAIKDYIANQLKHDQESDQLSIRGGHNIASGTAFYAGDDRPYEVLNRFQWYNADTGEEVNDIITADVKLGEKYSLVFRVDIKDEYYTTYRYAENLTVVLGGGYQYARADFVEVSTRSGNAFLEVTITYTVQPKVGEGDRVNYPVVCYTYNEFKYAMENENIRYVALANVNETLPVGEVGLVTAIQVKGIKNLQLLGDATFTAPAMAETTYAALLHVTQNTTLNISGTGSLTFKAVANNSFNAVLYNQGGSVNISSGALRGSYNTAVYGTAIWQEYGELRISGGQFEADNALTPLSLPRAKSAVVIQSGQAWIQGGTFRTRNWIDTIDLPYGLEIGQYATVDLSGGTFYGIKLPTDSTPLANYMDEDLYTPLKNESKFNPESVYSQQYTASGNIVRIAWLINHVDVHVNAPVAGVDITENYFNIPTSGCQATMYYPQWYKNGEIVTYGTFEAGASYKVVVQIEVKPGYGAEFTSGVTAAINNKSVTVKRLSAHWIEIEYDFGTCPATVSQVNLSTTAPKEGSIPASVTRGSTNYTVNDTQWLVSSTGADGTWSVMTKNTKYVAGKYYKLSVDLKAASGYRFATDENLDPAVFATLNGYSATVTRVYEQSADELICVQYYFGVCNKTTVESMIVENVTAPVMGESPTYTCGFAGSSYGYYTDMDNGSFRQNGMVWYDVTGGGNVILWNNEAFVAGRSYKLEVTARVQDGFTFANTVFATVNGDGNVTVRVNNGIWCTVSYTFTCQPKTISSVSVTGLDRPVDGAHPDFTALTDSEYYTVESITWFDCENDNAEMTASDTFAAGNRYWLMLEVVPTKTGSVNNAKFVKDKTTARLNGVSVQKINGDSWQDVSSGPKFVRIYYTFENTPFAEGPFSVSGEVISYDGTVDGTKIELVPYGQTTPAHTATINGGNTYSFPQVKAGIYLIYFKKDGYITREFILSVYNDVVQDSVMMRDYSAPKGDLDGNGLVDMDDAIYLLFHSFYEDDYPLNQPSDFDKDSDVDMDDAIYLLFHTFYEDDYPL